VPAWKPGVRATARSDVCTSAGRAAVARGVGVSPTAVRERRGIARSAAPECIFRARSLVLSVAVSGAPQAYAVLERGAEEQAQIFGAKRFTPAPQLILKLGVDAYWFPAEHLVMSTEGVNLITATVVSWPGVSHRRWKHLAAAAARPYLGRVSRKYLRGPSP
jgi:hypothetical protein